MEDSRVHAKRTGIAAALALLVLAACDQSPKPPAAPPVPKTEAGGAESPQIFREERKALERAKQVAPAVEDRERDMRERVERQER